MSQISIKTLMHQFVQGFNDKNSEAIGALLTDDFSLYDPSLKWIRGKKQVIDILKKQFNEVQKISYQVVHMYEECDTGIVEFIINLDGLTLKGVDFIEWRNGKMSELRCYYNPPNSENKALKPLSEQAQSLNKKAVYQHYKGNLYEVLSVGRHSETLEEIVVYRGLEDEEVWTRPVRLFLEKVVIDDVLRPRFKLVEN